MSVVSSGTLHHTCFVVHDVERTARSLAGALELLWLAALPDPEMTIG